MDPVADEVTEIYNLEKLSDDRIVWCQEQVFPSDENLGSGKSSGQIVIKTRSASNDNFLVFDRSYLNVYFHLLKSDGTALNDNTKLNTIASPWHLFDNIRMYINGTECDMVEQPGYINHMLNLVHCTSSNIKEVLPATGYYPFDNTNRETLAAGPAKTWNDEIYAASSSASPGQSNALVVKLPLRQVLGFCNVRKAIRNISADIRVQITNNVNRILYNSNVDAGGPPPVPTYGVLPKIYKMEWVIPSCKPNLGLFSEVTEKMVKGSVIPWNFEKYTYVDYNIAQTDAPQINVQQFVKRPKAVIVGMQNQDRQNLTTASCLSFDLLSLTSHSIKVNDKLYPQTPFGGSDGGYQREYHAFLDIADKDREEYSSTHVPLALWKSTFPLLAYDVSKNDDVSTTSNSSAYITWNAKITHAANKDTYVRFLTISDEYRQLIEKDGNVVVTAAV